MKTTKLEFTFDRENYFEADVTNETQSSVNYVIWALLDILKAKQVSLVRDDETK